ncbi:ABC transporter permease [Paenibacillus radicis (ex Xue et al. 2023)]|uniref:Iron export ABC transporter permease subunit FetB n=1 Tax=Paenibacillus radicis (ex Xue et al. 2023) TaxID=2972489 RepID=A0ABT1YMX9_9BACL|nr:iron export ABC transporter permease subunit FetB [Paenibacillus radicis (ex Xue et al. 2023)]MCR8634534.1 iron export ABC transporter permease subunit FetB [Paenibacillus radicis (ex Xue et al. 2023)]
MSNLALGFTLVFIVITILVSMWQKLGLEKDIIIGTIRSAVQLLLVGYLLQFVFNANHPAFLILILCAMIIIAAWNASHRAKGVSGIRWRIILAIGITEGLTMGLLLTLGIIDPTPQYIIPVSGIIIGNAMVVSGLYLNQMKREIQTSRGQIETLLSLGATMRQAIQESLKRSVKASMIPTIDGMKTMGLVQLPGMMTGMIVAGANPVEAVRYQVLIVFTIIAAAALSSIVLSMISYKLWFTSDEQLRSTV